MDLGSGQVRRICLPGGDRPLNARRIGAEPFRQGFEECNARAGRELGIAPEDFARERNTRSLSAAGQEIFAQLDQTFRAGRRRATPITREQRATALRDGLQQFTEKRCVHFTVTGPMI